MKVLVTGGAGFIGSVLVPMLLEDGYSVKVYDNLTYGLGGIIGCFNNYKFEFVEGDIRDENELDRAIRDCDAVIHLAATVGFPACKKDPSDSYGINAIGTGVVSKITGDLPMIFASTGSVYGKLTEVCTEESPTEPLTFYGKSKLKAEEIVQERGDSVVLRFATCFGISPRMRLDLLVNDFCYKALNERNLIVYEKNFKRTFLYITDMAMSFLFALDHFDDMKNELFNVGDEKMNCSKQDIAELIMKRTDYYLHYVEKANFHDEDERNYEVDYSKIHALGYTTNVSIGRGIDKLLKFFESFKIKKEYSNA